MGYIWFAREGYLSDLIVKVGTPSFTAPTPKKLHGWIVHCTIHP